MSVLKELLCAKFLMMAVDARNFLVQNVHLSKICAVLGKMHVI